MPQLRTGGGVGGGQTDRQTHTQPRGRSGEGRGLGQAPRLPHDHSEDEHAFPADADRPDAVADPRPL